MCGRPMNEGEAHGRVIRCKDRKHIRVIYVLDYFLHFAMIGEASDRPGLSVVQQTM